MMKNHRMRNLKVGIFICLTTLMGAWLLASEGSQEHHNADLGVETTDETTAPVPSDTDEVDTANNPALVEITTQFGSMIVQLSDSTPQHRDNFLKLVEEQYYDGLIFHRVIQDFMIQGGDPQSREASANSRLGNGGPGYTIEAEIRPDLIHTKGALAAARQGDNVNPQRRSSEASFTSSKAVHLVKLSWRESIESPTCSGVWKWSCQCRGRTICLLRRGQKRPT